MEHSYQDMILPMTTLNSGELTEVAPDLVVLTVQIVNVFFAGTSDGWVLIDAGMPRSADMIITAAEERFGEASPQAIVLTHGHFDHVGDIVNLIEHWNVPVYAHEMELPYLTGQQNYPEGDPSVGGGLVSLLSPLFPNQGINLGHNVKALPAGDSVPFLEGWRWIHTPGHSPGHISLFRDSDRTLIAGDAFVTVKQESLYNVFTQDIEVNGPPKYFTTHWVQARDSVKTLASLTPDLAITGHGQPIHGDFLTDELNRLAEHFNELAVPEQGRFVTH